MFKILLKKTHEAILAKPIIITESGCGYSVNCPHCKAYQNDLLMSITLALTGFGKQGLKRIELCEACNRPMRIY